MMIVAHNMAAMQAAGELKVNTDKQKKSTEKLSSGYRINRSSDDAAGLSISEKMRRQIRGLNRGGKNAQEGISLCQVADGALAETLDMMQRITQLSVQSANGTNSDSDRQDIQKEVHQLLSEMDRIADTTKFNEQKVFAEPKGFEVKNDSMLENMAKQLASASAGTPGTAAAGGAGGVSGGTATQQSPVRSMSWSGRSANSAVDLYTFDADSTNGVTITTSAGGMAVNSTTTPCNAITNQNGDGLDTLSDGTYTLSENGITFSFQVAGAQDIGDVALALDDAVATATTVTRSVLSPAVTNPTVSIVSDSAITAAGGLGLGTHRISADANGITLGGQTVSWSATNLSSVSVGGGSLAVDFGNGIALSFDVADGTTETEAAAAFNGTTFTIERDTGSITFSGTGTQFASGNGPTTYNARNFDWTMLTDPFHDSGLRDTGLLGGTAPISSSTVGSMTVTFAGGDYGSSENTRATLNMGTGTTPVTYNITADSLQRIRQARSQGNLDAGSSIPVSFVHGNSTFTMNFEMDSSIAGGSFLATKGETYTYTVSGIQEGLKVSGFSVNSMASGNQVAGEVTTYDMAISGVRLWQGGGSGGGSQGASWQSIYSALKQTAYGRKYADDRYPIYGGEKSWWIQSGAGTLEGMVLKISAVGTKALGLDGLDVSTVDGALDSLDRMDGAMKRVNEIRAKVGAQQNRLERSVQINANTSENLQAAESKIRDTDMSKEIVGNMKQNILEQVGDSMLAQANQNTQGALSLLQQ